MVAAAVHVNVETSLLKFAVRQKKIITTKENGEHSQELILHEHSTVVTIDVRVN